LLSGTDWIIRKITNSTDINIEFLPLLDWIDVDGRDKIAKSKQLNAHTKEHLFATANEILHLQRFCDYLFSRADISVGEFILQANEAFEPASKSSDLRWKMRWDTHRSIDSSYLTSELFSTGEIVEAGARLCEARLLERCKNRDIVLSSWMDESIHGIYKPAFEWLMSELNDFFAASLAVDLALMSPIDLVNNAAPQGTIFVEDVHPGWRLPKIVDAMRRRFMPLTKEGCGAYFDDVMRIAGLPSVSGMLSQILDGPLNGPISWNADEIIFGKRRTDLMSMAILCDYVECEFRANFLARVQNPLFGVTSTLLSDTDSAAKVRDVRPILEFYLDRALINETEFFKKYGFREGLPLKLYYSIIRDLLTLSFLQDGKVSPEVLWIEKSFLNMMMEYMNRGTFRFDPDEFTKLNGAKYLAATQFDRASELLDWP
jgi:hypothetical protein